MRPSFFLLIYICFPLSIIAASPSATADSAYRQKDYATAARLYEACLAKESSDDEAAACHYNLGNAFYRLKDFPHAILHYQRALKLNPADDDAAFNLELTQTKLADHFDEPSEMFFITWFRNLVHAQSYKSWGLWGIAVLILAFIGWECYTAGGLLWLRRTGFITSLACMVCFVLFQIFAFAQYHSTTTRQLAVVMQEAETFDTPTPSAKKLRTLHEGTTLTLTDSYKGGWLEARLPDGTTCWLKEAAVERV